MKDYIIGIDHGNGFMKTVGSVFISGVDTYKTEPPMLENVLKYDDAYHVIGENRKAYDPDKTKTMDYYYLTLAAIAREIELRKYPRKDGSFILACGLPIEFFGSQKGSFRDYLSQKKEVFFSYCGRDYQIKIKKVLLFPQGFAAIAPQIPTIEARTNVLDVGSKTLDVIPLVDKKPVLSKCVSLPLGILTGVDNIQKAVRMKYNMELEDYTVQSVLQMRTKEVPAELVEVIQEQTREYVRKALERLEQSGISLRFQNCRFCCGGALVFKNYGSLTGNNISFHTDIHANAKGFEWLCKGLEK